MGVKGFCLNYSLWDGVSSQRFPMRSRWHFCSADVRSSESALALARKERLCGLQSEASSGLRDLTHLCIQRIVDIEYTEQLFLSRADAHSRGPTRCTSAGRGGGGSSQIIEPFVKTTVPFLLTTNAGL